MNTRILRKVVLFVLALGLASRGFGHEGHGIPGALPPAPHGGVVQEAKEKAHKEGEHEEGEAELFFEAVYKDKELRLYPLELPRGNNPMFKVLSPRATFSSVSMKIEFPRAKLVQEARPQIDADAIRIPFDAKNTNRFIVHLVAKQEKEEKLVSIQLENE